MIVALTTSLTSSKTVLLFLKHTTLLLTAGPLPRLFPTWTHYPHNPMARSQLHSGLCSDVSLPSLAQTPAGPPRPPSLETFLPSLLFFMVHYYLPSDTCSVFSVCLPVWNVRLVRAETVHVVPACIARCLIHAWHP